MAGIAGPNANHIIAHIAVGLRLLVVRFPGLGRLKETLDVRLRVDGGGRSGRSWARRLALVGSGSFVLGILIPTDLFLGGGSYTGVSIGAEPSI